MGFGIMRYCEINDYVLCDFAEYYLGYSLKGSGRFVDVEKVKDMKILKVKRFFLNRCDNNEFIFTADSCILSRNYWHNQDISQEFDKFLQEQEYSI